MTRMSIERLVARDGDRHAVVVLSDSDRRRRLAFTVPLDEAHRLARALGWTPCSCVPVLDLVDRILESLGGRATHVVIDGWDGGIAARLCVDGPERGEALDCHPADGLALAVRRALPIYASDLAMTHAEAISTLPTDGVPEWIERIAPEDFSR